MIHVAEHGYHAAIYDLSIPRYEAVQVIRVWEAGRAPRCPWLRDPDCVHTLCRDRCNVALVGDRWVCSQTVVGHIEMDDEDLARADLGSLLPAPAINPAFRDPGSGPRPGGSGPEGSGPAPQ